MQMRQNREQVPHGNVCGDRVKRTTAHAGYAHDGHSRAHQTVGFVVSERASVLAADTHVTTQQPRRVSEWEGWQAVDMVARRVAPMDGEQDMQMTK